MYHCDLVEKYGYKIVYEPGELSNDSYFGVNTLDRIIFLINVKPGDVSTIERLLFSADSQYKGLHDK
jgi:hypothetical protein